MNKALPSVYGIRLRVLEGPGDFRPREGSPREFHISREAREKYGFDEALFSIRGNVVFADFPAVRNFAALVNSRRDAARRPDQAVKAGQLNAMGLIDEILHYVVTLYREKYGNKIFSEALEFVKGRIGLNKVRGALEFFVRDFPPLAVHRGEVSPAEYLKAVTDGVSNEEIVFEEMLLLWLANDNPAFAPFGEFFDDTDLRGRTVYLRMIGGLKDFFADQPKFGPDNESLADMLKAPALASPYSLTGQLDYIRRRWGLLLGRFLERLLRSMDVIREEEKARWGVGPGPTEVYSYTGAGYADEEFERFSPDRDWMPKVVLIAKSTLVWLDQLSRSYGRRIATLDDVPDGELDLLAARGINGLWLIGLWERSRASRRIKEKCGNPDAVASAYSLDDYEVAQELGGWGALAELRRRCWKRGIRLASDMVPNHTGIDSRWMIQHPDWFIQTSHPPFPSYSFNGENLSHHPDVGLFLEDHYYDRSDAAVVFKRVHWPSGDTRYIYHGNDGTHMPWNDTAQLNFLIRETREAVIQTILHVARNFPIIRFDAAMTLAKRHYQRLWYPEPGSGGDIPSRAERGLSRDEFNRLFPEEFWREVVDRAAAECPDTLLLAEAFWMMEGYFVRTLGMHRVYNSAFMNMLKMEENEKYRATIKNTQEFDRDILKRHVNFMNNPDEETAIAQFGDGDKYFGVCTLMVTMPGLPMFGHGQIEGFQEKYGMEFRRAYRNEEPNPGLVERHEREIFPLVKKRYLFAEVENFLLYDLYTEHGGVNENVFAYSNRQGGERTLVLYNNAYSSAWGWIRLSSAFAEKTPEGEKFLVQRTLGQGLDLHPGEDWYCILREQRSNRWYIRSSREIHEKGLFINLRGYESQVFLDLYEVQDDRSGTWRRLAESLNGAGVESVEEALREMVFSPVYSAFRPLVDHWFPALSPSIFGGGEGLSADEEDGFRAAYGEFLLRVGSFRGEERDADRGVREAVAGLGALSRVFSVLGRDGGPTEEKPKPGKSRKKPGAGKEKKIPDPAETGWEFMTLRGPGVPAARELAFCWVLLRGLGFGVGERGKRPTETARLLVEDLALDREAARFFGRSGASEVGERLRLLLKVLLFREDWFDGARRFDDPGAGARIALESLLGDQDAAICAGVNSFQEVLYFNREGFFALAWWMTAAALTRRALEDERFDPGALRKAPEIAMAGRWVGGAEPSGYRLEELYDLLDPDSDLGKPDLHR